MSHFELVVLLLVFKFFPSQGASTWDNDYYKARGHLIFEEQFDVFDTARWQHIISAAVSNNEFQYYSNRPENSYARDGLLYLKPTLTADRFGEDFLFNGVLDLKPDGCTAGCTAMPGVDIINPIQSARIRTINSFSFTYGTVEVRAKMPRGDWIWPAIWLMPTDNSFGGWPRSGEIDMVEIRGNNDFRCQNKQIGNQLMGSTLHFGTDPQHNVWRLTHYEAFLEESDFSTDFHVYGLQWLPDGMRFFVDGVEIGQVNPPPGGFWELGRFDEDPGGHNIWANGTTMTPFDRRFHFILNVAVGGSYFPDGCANHPHPKPWKNSSRQQKLPFWMARKAWYSTWNAETEDNAMQVDYIRVYGYDELAMGQQFRMRADLEDDRSANYSNALDKEFEHVY